MSCLWAVCCWAFWRRTTGSAAYLWLLLLVCGFFFLVTFATSGFGLSKLCFILWSICAFSCVSCPRTALNSEICPIFSAFSAEHWWMFSIYLSILALQPWYLYNSSCASELYGSIRSTSFCTWNMMLVASERARWHLASFFCFNSSSSYAFCGSAAILGLDSGPEATVTMRSAICFLSRSFRDWASELSTNAGDIGSGCGWFALGRHSSTISVSST